MWFDHYLSPPLDFKLLRGGTISVFLTSDSLRPTTVPGTKPMVIKYFSEGMNNSVLNELMNEWNATLTSEHLTPTSLLHPGKSWKWDTAPLGTLYLSLVKGYKFSATRKSHSGRKWSRFVCKSSPGLPARPPRRGQASLTQRPCRFGFICSYISLCRPCLSLILLDLLHPGPLVIFSNLLERGIISSQLSSEKMKRLL